MKTGPKAPPLKVIVGSNIRRARLSRDWSQEKLGELSDLSQVSISGIESGKTATNLDAIERIAKSLGIEPLALFNKH